MKVLCGAKRLGRAGIISAGENLYKEFETTVFVDGEVYLTITAKTDIAPGIHRAVVTAEENGKNVDLELDMDYLEEWPELDWPWPEGFSLRRKDMYDERGR